MSGAKPIIVQKFGGTSVASLDLISKIAESASKISSRLVMVVSAMAGETNKAVSCCLAISQLGTSLELAAYDAAISSCENFSASIMALALNNYGVKAVALQGWQVPIVTDDSFGNAKVRKVELKRLLAHLDAGVVPVICGFQGVNQEGSITTLGRGGSDTTAAAIAAALKADCCEIYTDVDGVFSADPRVVPNARLIPEISYEEMLCLASGGAKVLEKRSVAIAMQYKVPLRVINPNSSCPGTKLTNNNSRFMESPQVKGIALRDDIAFCQVETKNLPEFAKLISGFSISNLQIDCDMGVCSFEVLLTEKKQLEKFLKGNSVNKYLIDIDSAYVSIVGWNLHQSKEVIEKALAALGKEKVSSISVENHCIKLKLSLQRCNKLVKALHAELIEQGGSRKGSRSFG